MYIYLLVGHYLERFVSETPYLIQQTAIAPHITGCGVLAKGKSFWCCPLDRNLPSMGHIVVIINQIPRHSKITDLKKNTTDKSICIICNSYMYILIWELCMCSLSLACPCTHGQGLAYLADTVFRNQYIPCCNVTMNKALPRQVL